MSERKITCPWCGPEQVMQPVTNEHPLNRQWTAYYMCGECCAGTPNAYGRTEQEAIEAAYLAATATHPADPKHIETLRRMQREACDRCPEYGRNCAGRKCDVHDAIDAAIACIEAARKEHQ